MFEWLKRLSDSLVGIRKVVMFTALLVVTTALLLTGFISGADFAAIWVTTGPATFAANLGEHFLQRRRRARSR